MILYYIISFFKQIETCVFIFILFYCFSDPFHLLQHQTPPAQQISTQPIQIRVPKNKVNEIRESI